MCVGWEGLGGVRAEPHTVPEMEFLFNLFHKNKKKRMKKKKGKEVMKSNKLVLPNNGKRPCIFNYWKRFCGWGEQGVLPRAVQALGSSRPPTPAPPPPALEPTPKVLHTCPQAIS